MKRENFLLLLNQFMLSKGYDKADTNSKDFMDEFAAWILERQQIGEEFKGLLDEVGYNYKAKNVVEANKSKQDSLILPYESTLITPFYDGLEVSYKRLCPALFGISGSTPTTYTNEFSTGVNICFLNSFMVNNPYDDKYLNNMENVLNNGFLAGEVGFYGSTSDKDYKKHIEQLKAIKEKVRREYTEEQVTNGDHYGLVLTTKRNF